MRLLGRWARRWRLLARKDEGDGRDVTRLSFEFADGKRADELVARAVSNYVADSCGIGLFGDCCLVGDFRWSVNFGADEFA